MKTRGFDQATLMPLVLVCLPKEPPTPQSFKNPSVLPGVQAQGLTESQRKKVPRQSAIKKFDG